jgi:hypothetical protein
MRPLLSITAVISLLICTGCNQGGGTGRSITGQGTDSEGELIEIAEGAPAWATNTVLSLKFYHPDGSVGGSERGFRDLRVGKSVSGYRSPDGRSCALIDRPRIFRSNGLEVVFIRRESDGAGWLDETNVILVPYDQGKSTNRLGNCTVVSEIR